MVAESRVVQPLVKGRVRVPRAHGVRRARLIERLRDLPQHRLGLVVAPAGSGKTTLLAHVAEASPWPAAWLTLDAASGDEAAFLLHLRAALSRVLPGLGAGWRSTDEGLADLENAVTAPLLLILDDLHAVTDQPAVGALRLLLEYQPAQMRTLIATRTLHRIDLHRLRLAGDVLDIDAEALRFRTWEVEELFRDWYGVELGPQEAASLTRRTDGWAAGLQLFHLATDGQPPSKRTRILQRTGVGTRLTRDYLAANVLDAVSAELRSFLIRTSVLDELTSRRCDLLLEARGSAEHLAELERRGLFTFVDDDGRTYRYHEVLRTHLVETLLVQHGTEIAKDLHRQAGRILEDEGALTDAIRAYSRSEDWDEVRRVLSQQGRQLADDPGTWIDLLPEAIRERDPWVLLALARRLVAQGSFERAADVYRQALGQLWPERGAGPGVEELRALESWQHPEPGRVVDWVQIARTALIDPRLQPGGPAVDLPLDELAHGFARLVAGEVAEARARFGRVADRRDVSLGVETAALIGRALCCALTGDPGADAAAEEALAAAKLLGAPAVLRLAHATGLLAPGVEEVPVDHLLGECRRDGDGWVAAVLQLLHGLRLLTDGRDGGADLRDAQRAFDDLGAPVLAAWAAAGIVLADVGQHRDPGGAAIQEAERLAKRAGPLPYAMVLLAVAAREPDPRARTTAQRLAASLAERSGTAQWVRRLATTLQAAPAGPVPLPSPAPVPEGNRQRPPQVKVRCLGGFAIEVDGAALDLSAVRPRNLELLRILCLHANRRVHREQLAEWVWPGRPPAQGSHSLQVAISGLRKVLEPDAPRGKWTLLRREGETYRLVLGGDEDADVRVVEGHLAAARKLHGLGDASASAVDERRAIEAYGGDLLPGDGPAEWVVRERDRLRSGVADACERLAGHLAEVGDHEEAARVAWRGLELDRYRDGLWQRRIDSLLALGNPAEAAAARQDYRDLLADLDEDTSGR